MDTFRWTRWRAFSSLMVFACREAGVVWVKTRRATVKHSGVSFPESLPCPSNYNHFTILSNFPVFPKACQHANRTGSSPLLTDTSPARITRDVFSHLFRTMRCSHIGPFYSLPHLPLLVQNILGGLFQTPPPWSFIIFSELLFCQWYCRYNNSRATSDLCCLVSCVWFMCELCLPN